MDISRIPGPPLGKAIFKRRGNVFRVSYVER
jgi:hypothetical protein